MLPEDYVQRVNEVTDIVQVIGEHVQLIKAGSEFVGLCPFHGEKTASFSVNPGKGVFMCRGCGEAGNAVQFLMKTQGSSFQETMLALGKRAGIAPPAPSYGQAPDSGRLDRLQQIIVQAQNIYQSDLLAPNDDARNALAYIRERGVTDEMIERFGIGYSARDGGLRNKIPDVVTKDLVDAGLIYKSEYYNGDMREWMCNRIVFPIFSASGKPIAFGGRAMHASAKAKYINTPETILFKKGSELYGQYQAGNSIRRQGVSIVTEGYMDVVVPSGVGVTNTVASMGTAFSEESLKKLFRMGDSVVFCFDGDAPGYAAAVRAMKTAANVIDEKKVCKFAFLPEGMDPDDYVRKHGAASYQELIDKADPMSRFMVKHFSKKNDTSYAEGKASFARDCMDIIERIPSPMLKALMVEDVKSVIGPHIPLPGVTPGVDAVVPHRTASPHRSAVRVFKSMLVVNSDAEGSVEAETPNFMSESEQIVPGQNRSRIFRSLAPGMELEIDKGKKDAVAKESSSAFGLRETPAEYIPTTMINAAREAASQLPPSQALRLLAFVLREPVLAEEPINAVDYIGAPLEIAALAAASFEAMPRDDMPAVVSKTLVSQLQGGTHCDTVKIAIRLPEFLAQDMDAIAEATALVNRAADRVYRAERAKRMRMPKPKPKP